MSDENLPYFKFFPSDFMGSGKVQMMGPAERGIYISLLCWSWQEGAIPDDPRTVARIAGATRDEMEQAWPIVRRCFEQDEDGNLYHRRLEKERQDALERMERRRKMSEAGRKGAAKRWADRDGDSPPTDEAGNDGFTTRGSNASESHRSHSSDVHDSSKRESENNAPQGGRDGNRWSETVAACREHLWLDDAPPEGRSIKQELSVAKQLLDRWNLEPPDVAEAVEGFARLREQGFWGDWVPRGKPAKMLALNQTPDDAQGIPVVVRCLHEMRKGERASRGDGGMERLKVSA